MKGTGLLALLLVLGGCGGGGIPKSESASVGGTNHPPVILFTTEYYSGSAEIGLGSIDRTNRLSFGGGVTFPTLCGDKVAYIKDGEVRVVDAWPPYAHANDHAVPGIPIGVSTISGPSLVFCKDGVFKINLDGSGLIQLRPSGTFGMLTPDGTKLGYIDGSHVFVADAAGQNPVQLSGMSADWLTVSNQTAVFHSGNAIYSVPLSGGSPQLLAPTDNFKGMSFMDADTLLFASKPPELDQFGNPIEIPTDFGDIWKVSLSTKQVLKFLDLGKQDAYPCFVGSYAAIGGL